VGLLLLGGELVPGVLLRCVHRLPDHGCDTTEILLF